MAAAGRLIGHRPYLYPDAGPVMTRHAVVLHATHATALALAFASIAVLPARVIASNCAGTSTGLIPVTDLGTGFYQGLQGGLYPGGSNLRPSAHEAAGIAIANAIVPLDTLGSPDPTTGHAVFVSIGMGNCTQGF